jgi:NAD-dependent dihydropyrimidine dehydrogenase PreA subunit
MKEATKIRRKIVKIDEEKCDGCGACVISCAEGALQIVDGKARLVSDKYCDSLGACLPGCPQGAISIEERVAEPFDEEAVKDKLAREAKDRKGSFAGCPSAEVRRFDKPAPTPLARPSIAPSAFRQAAGDGEPRQAAGQRSQSQLSHWPVQLMLVPPKAAFLQGADVLLAADCSAFCYAGFHPDYLKDRALLIACPKLNDYEEHTARLVEILHQSEIKSLTVVRIEVPCCSGLTRMAMQAILASKKDIPFKEIILGVRGDCKS